jgi:hypothetical protein
VFAEDMKPISQYNRDAEDGGRFEGVSASDVELDEVEFKRLGQYVRLQRR